MVSAELRPRGHQPDTQPCLTLDADHLQDAPGAISTDDGRSATAPLRPSRRSGTTRCRRCRSARGALKNLIYVATDRATGARRLRRRLAHAVRRRRGPAAARRAGPAGRRRQRRRRRAATCSRVFDLTRKKARARSRHRVVVRRDGRGGRRRATGACSCDVVHTQVELHAPYGGVVPELASRDHLRNVGPVVREALARAGVALADVDGIAVTNRPGLVGALLVGVQAAKGLAWAAGKPLVGVDHLVGHLLAVFSAARRTERRRPSPRFPFVACSRRAGTRRSIASTRRARTRIVELGATRDDAAGEAFDKVAKLLGLGYPGGPAIDRLAPSGDASRVTLSAPMAARGSLEMSFSGIKTQVAQLVAREGPARPRRAARTSAPRSRPRSRRRSREARRRRASARASATWCSAAASRRTASSAGASPSSGEARGLRVLVPPLASCTDNAAMIAYAGAAAPRARRARRLGPRRDERDGPRPRDAQGPRASGARLDRPRSTPVSLRSPWPSCARSQSCFGLVVLACLADLPPFSSFFAIVSSRVPAGARAMTSVSPRALTW